MRVAIFSDVHGNATALEAVLADIKEQGSFDHIVFAGDLVFVAGQPRKCIELLQSHNISGVVGNTDLFLWEPETMPEDVDDAERAEWEAYFKTIEWLNTEVGDNGLAYLKSLPFEIRLKPDSVAEHDLLVVHANPKDILRPIFPNETLQQQLKGKITQPDADVLPLLEGVTARTIAFGHVHIPNIRHIAGYTLANISSVNRPLDNDWRAKWAILEFNDDHWAITHRYVEYDAQKARQIILESSLPQPEEIAQTIILPD